MNRTIEDIQKDIELLGIKGGYDIEQLLTPQDCRRLSYEIEKLKLELSGYRQAILQDKEMLGLKQEIERLNNIINELLKRQNEALNYISNFLSMDNRYKHGNGNDELELVRRILNKHNQELKGSDKE